MLSAVCCMNGLEPGTRDNARGGVESWGMCCRSIDREYCGLLKEQENRLNLVLDLLMPCPRDSFGPKIGPSRCSSTTRIPSAFTLSTDDVVSSSGDSADLNSGASDSQIVFRSHQEDLWPCMSG